MANYAIKAKVRATGAEEGHWAQSPLSASDMAAHFNDLNSHLRVVSVERTDRPEAVFIAELEPEPVAVEPAVDAAPVVIEPAAEPVAEPKSETGAAA
jgi:hypothetical protein